MAESREIAALSTRVRRLEERIEELERAAKRSWIDDEIDDVPMIVLGRALAYLQLTSDGFSPDLVVNDLKESIMDPLETLASAKPAVSDDIFRLIAKYNAVIDLALGWSAYRHEPNEEPPPLEEVAARFVERLRKRAGSAV